MKGRLTIELFRVYPSPDSDEDSHSGPSAQCRAVRNPKRRNRSAAVMSAGAPMPQGPWSTSIRRPRNDLSPQPPPSPLPVGPAPPPPSPPFPPPGPPGPSRPLPDTRRISGAGPTPATGPPRGKAGRPPGPCLREGAGSVSQPLRASTPTLNDSSHPTEARPRPRQSWCQRSAAAPPHPPSPPPHPHIEWALCGCAAGIGDRRPCLLAPLLENARVPTRGLLLVTYCSWLTRGSHEGVTRASRGRHEGPLLACSCSCSGHTRGIHAACLWRPGRPPRGRSLWVASKPS